MANIFVTDLQIHRRFDIKGSTEGRTVGEEARRRADTDPTVIFKVCVRGFGGLCMKRGGAQWARRRDGGRTQIPLLSSRCGRV